MRLTKIFMAIFAPDESLPSSATLMWKFLDLFTPCWMRIPSKAIPGQIVNCRFFRKALIKIMCSSSDDDFMGNKFTTNKVKMLLLSLAVWFQLIYCFFFLTNSVIWFSHKNEFDRIIIEWNIYFFKFYIWCNIKTKPKKTFLNHNL